MSLKQLVSAIDALSSTVRAFGGETDNLTALRELATARPTATPAALSKAVSGLELDAQAGAADVTASEASGALRHLRDHLAALGAMKGVLKTADVLAVALEGLGEASVAAIGAELRRQDTAADAERRARAAAKAEKEVEAAERVRWYEAKFRKTEPERDKLLAVFTEIEELGKSFGAAEWRALAKALSGQSGRTKSDAQRFVRGWIATVARHRDGIRSMGRLHAEGY
ncbi:MAG: hypothetical protein AAFW46_00110 [Pseudomonadota bacterium]